MADEYVPQQYPKAVNSMDSLKRLVPLIWPDKHPKAGQQIVLASAEEEQAFEKEQPELAAKAVW